MPDLIAEWSGFESVLNVGSGQGFLLWESLFLFIVLPAVLFGLCGLLARLLTGRKDLWSYVQVYALAFIPLILSLHLAKGFHKFNGHITSLPHILSNPQA